VLRARYVLGLLFLSATRLLCLATLRSAASLLCGFALCAFCLLAFVRSGALGKLAVLLLFVAAKLFGLLAFLRFLFVSAMRLLFLATLRSAASLLCGFALCAFCLPAFLRCSALG
jgi:hypothetical protein